MYDKMVDTIREAYGNYLLPVSGIWNLSSANTDGWVHSLTVQLCEYCRCYGVDEKNKCKSCGAPMIPIKEYEDVWNTSTG